MGFNSAFKGLIHPVSCIDVMRHPFTQTVSPITPITIQSPHLSPCPTVLNYTELCNDFNEFVSDLSIIYKRYCKYCVATGYGLDGLEIEPQWGARFSAPVQTGPGALSASCTMGTGSSSGVKSGRGVTLTLHSF